MKETQQGHIYQPQICGTEWRATNVKNEENSQ